MLSHYHKRQYCSRCDWFAEPRPFLYDGYSVECCPDCGEDVYRLIGQLKYHITRERVFDNFFCRFVLVDVKYYTDFVLK